MKKLLSICIPTFNRQGYLDALLANIEKQLKQFDLYQKVEVIVSDNCSEDETASTATKYANFVDYSRNDKNIGPDANFLSLFSKAEGEYIWLPGDDDEIRGDTIAYIINCIEELKFDFLYLKTEGEQIVQECVCEDEMRSVACGCRRTIRTMCDACVVHIAYTCIIRITLICVLTISSTYSFGTNNSLKLNMIHMQTDRL